MIGTVAAEEAERIGGRSEKVNWGEGDKQGMGTFLVTFLDIPGSLCFQVHSFTLGGFTG